MKKLPELYKNKVTTSTNKSYDYGNSSKEKSKEVITTRDKEEVLKKLFQNQSSAYTKKVQIKTKEKTYETRLVYQTENELITIDNEKIKKEDILFLTIL